MSPSATLKQPKETDSVLLRVPSALRERAAQEASENNLSQNAFISNSLLFGVLVFGERKYVGTPKNLLDLIEEIDSSFKTGDATLAAFHTQDWKEVSVIVDLLVTCDVLANLKVRPDTKAGEATTVFTFTMTKNGRVCWPLLKDLLTWISRQASKQDPLPAMLEVAPV